MITNETRAKLIGRKPDLSPNATVRETIRAYAETPSFDTDANAVAELRAFVRARGKRTEFVAQLAKLTPAGSMSNPRKYGWYLLDATPAQQCAAFDIVFKDELEKL